MDLDWNTFLTDEGLLPYDPWSDLLQPTTAPPSDMPKSSSTRIPGSEPEAGVNFESLLNGTSTDPFFDDALFTSNDYFLSDLEVLQPLGDMVAGGESTPESSPEPTSATTTSGLPFSASQNLGSTSMLSNQSPYMTSVQRQNQQRPNTFSNPGYEAMFPSNIESGFVEDVILPNGPTGPASSSRSSVDNIKSTANTTKKRNKAKNDSLSACWTSPLCPNHDQFGPAPDPSSCGGECAPFLFADQDTLPTETLNSLMVDAKEITAEDGVVEIQPRRKKRSESETSSGEPSGRQFEDQNFTNASPIIENEGSQDSPDPPAADETKIKSSRRLPHNQVERKYRESLNTQLESLRRVVPALQKNQGPCDGADIEDLPAPSKPSKAVILASATAYIKQMEKERKRVADENALLKTRVKHLQALVKCDDCNLMQYVMNLKINAAQQK
ncbi:hypothetical protein BDV95DRAFT_597038 [Massariosphaeria phaeospora]|uniref:BHLH domain-containing protein n=1 Tax=Massariosphaeria phaeospora TaxID=100035 RepID=A0A7C8I5K7_9PLEO|nr:hypothetical protein BDV95DRAFT_597038 [Massariosphaeria phaeospora]